MLSITLERWFASGTISPLTGSKRASRIKYHYLAALVLLGALGLSACDQSQNRREDDLALKVAQTVDTCDSRALQDAMTVMSSSLAGLELAAQQPLAVKESLAQLSIAALDMAYRHRTCLMKKYEFGYDKFFAQHFHRWLNMARLQHWPQSEQAKASELIRRFEALTNPITTQLVSADTVPTAPQKKTAKHHDSSSQYVCSPALFDDSIHLLNRSLNVLHSLLDQSGQIRDETNHSLKLSARRASEHAVCAAKILPQAQWLRHIQSVDALLAYSKSQAASSKTDAYLTTIALALQGACQTKPML